MKSRISAHARELGFDLCRVTSAASPETGAAFSTWLDLRRYGNMSYLPRSAARRRDPQRVLPGAQSIICVAVNYALCGPNNSAIGLSPTIDRKQADETVRAPTERAQPRGLVARYAQFNDYHDVMGHRLDSLIEFMHQLGGAGTRSAACVDTGPVLEREFAQRAGIGFVGKHTNLISRRFGNWLLPRYLWKPIHPRKTVVVHARAA
jgi:epoxyqueuosine reductase